MDDLFSFIQDVYCINDTIWCKVCGRTLPNTSEYIYRYYIDIECAICHECVNERSDIVKLVDYRFAYDSFVPVLVVDILIGELHYRKIDSSDIADHISTNFIHGLAHILALDEITLQNAHKAIRIKLDGEDGSSKDIVEKFNLLKASDDIIAPAVDEAIAENAQAVIDYQCGNKKALNRILGSVMQKTKGKADPKIVNELLQSKLQQEK